MITEKFLFNNHLKKKTTIMKKKVLSEEQKWKISNTIKERNSSKKSKINEDNKDLIFDEEDEK